MDYNEIQLFSKIVEIETQIELLRQASRRLEKQASEIYPKANIPEPKKKVAALPYYNYQRPTQNKEEMPFIFELWEFGLFEYLDSWSKYFNWKSKEQKMIIEEEKNKQEALQQAREQQKALQLQYDDEYAQQMIIYHQQLIQQNKDVTKSNILLLEKDNLNRQRLRLSDLKCKYYDMANIHERYRNLAAMVLIKEYFELGICNSLEGINGAYAMARKELLEKEKITQLDEISFKLDMLHEDNMALAAIFDSVGRRVDRLTNTIASAVYEVSNKISDYSNNINANVAKLQNSLNEQTSLMKEKSELMQKELEYSNWLATYKELNKRV